MQHYVPGFILQECEEKRYAGSITAFALFFDIADFTETSNKFRRLGSKGAEALSNFLTAAFAYPIMQVESQGGFISHFAGDAFCAIFPGSDCRAIRTTIGNIQSHFADFAYHDLELGVFPISIRLTLTHGEVEWKILQSRIQHEYVFSGSPLQEIYSLSNHKEACMLSPAVQKAFAASPMGSLEVSPLSFAYTETTRQLFTKAKLVDLEVENEIRDAAYCFVDISRIEESRLEAVLESIHSKLEDYSGFLNKIDATDKGLVALVLFGLPKAIGNTLERMCRFALEMITEEPKLSMGLACGSAYAGYVGCADTREFTALGSAVNLASRLMQKAGVREIVTDSYLQQEMHYKYRFAASEPMKLKGFALEVHSHKLLDRLPRPPQSFHTDFVGREEEIVSLRQEAKEPGSRIIYISGEPGMGKSRLILEALKPFPQSYFLFSDPSVHRLLEPIKQLVGQYFAIDPLFSKQRKSKLFRQKWQEIAQDDKELIRIESIIGQLLGYEWERSVWSMLQPEEKPEQLKNAFVSFIIRITRDEKMIIHLDDPQWLDDSTLEYFRLLGEKNVEGVTIFAACRYLDDGSEVDLEIPNWESKHVDLALLNPETAAVMVKQILGVESIPEDSLDWIVRKADGNPLFLEQVVAYLKENNCFDAEHKLVGNLDYLSSFGIADIIGSRIDSLTENVRNTLQHACVLGLEFNTRVLCEMLSRKLDEDLGKGKQAKVWADLDELRYIFTHVLIKDTAYNRMLSDRLKKLHLIATEAMESLYKDDDQVLNEHAEEIARHFEIAGFEEMAATYYDKAGTYHMTAFAFNKSELCLTKALAICTRIYGEWSVHAGDVLMKIGSLKVEQGDYVSAKKYFIKAMELFKLTNGHTCEKYIIAIIKVAFAMEELAEFDQTLDYFERALILSRNSFGDLHDITIRALYNLGIHYLRTGDYGQALDYLKQVVESDEAMGVSNTVIGTKHLNDLAICCARMGSLKKAKEYFSKAYSNMLKLQKVDNPYTVRILKSLGDVAYAEGDLVMASQIHLKCIEIIEPILGTNHTDTGDAYTSYANVISDLAKHQEALSMMKRALEIQRHLDRPLEIAACLHDLGNIYTYMEEVENIKLGIECYKESINLKESVWKRDHPKIATSYESLGNAHYMIGEFDIAYMFYQTTSEMLRRLYGDKHFLVARCENNIGDVLGELGRYEESLMHFQSSLSIFQKTVDDNSVLLISVLINYGVTLSTIGNIQEAIKQLKRSIDIILQTDAGCKHMHYQVAVNAIIHCYRLLDESEKVAEFSAMLIDQSGE